MADKVRALRPLINTGGKTISLGVSIAVPEAVRAAPEIVPQFVETSDFQWRQAAPAPVFWEPKRTSCLACASAGITVSVAGTNTGPDLARSRSRPGISSTTVRQWNRQFGWLARG